MCQGTLFSDSPKSDEISKTEAIAFRRVYLRRKKLVLRTSASGFSSSPWQSPRAADSSVAFQRDNHEAGMERDSLLGEARNWRTPQIPSGGPVDSMQEFGAARGILNLQGEAQQWCTPGAMGGGSVSRSGDRIGEPLLAGQAESHWMTPFGLGNVDAAGKLGAGGEFAKQAEQWATPAAERITHRTDTPTSQAGGTKTLGRDVASWPTPNVPNRGPELKEDKREQSGAEDLQTAAQNWPSPRSEDAESCGNHPEATDSLTGAVENFDATRLPWGTPRQADYKGADTQGHHVAKNYLTGHAEQEFRNGHPSAIPPSAPDRRTTGDTFLKQIASLRPRYPEGTTGAKLLRNLVRSRRATTQNAFSKRKLNPCFVDWLQGLPVGHTDSTQPLGMSGSAREAMASYLSARRLRLSHYLRRLCPEMFEAASHPRSPA